jgi:hypothetical protein
MQVMTVIVKATRGLRFGVESQSNRNLLESWTGNNHIILDR